MEARRLSAWPWVVGSALALAGAGFLVWRFVMRDPEDSNAGSSSSAAGGLVEGLERLRGVRPNLWAFFVWWDQHGPFPLYIPTDAEAKHAGANSPVLRQSDSDQAAAAAQGSSKATTVRQTPHGRWAAVDAWVKGFNPHVAWPAQPQDIKDKFARYGKLATQWRGGGVLKWGGDWVGIVGPYGDQPHVEEVGWTALPFPPPIGGYA